MFALYLASVVGFAVLAQWLAWSLRVPAILLLLITGLSLGAWPAAPSPDLLLGDLLFPIISLSVAVILFEGALTLKLKDLKGIGHVVRNLCSIGVLATFSVIALASYLIMDLDWRVATLLGAVLTVTGPTVIAPMLSIIRPKKEIDRILRWEGIVIDPIGALFAVLVFEGVTLSQHSDLLSHTLLALGKTLLVGCSLGVAMGWFTTHLIRRKWLPHELHKFGVLAIVLLTMTLSNHLSEESGLLAVTILGIWMANQDDLEIDAILEFKEDLSMILISALFILLAARLNLGDLWQLGPMVLLLMIVVQFIARPFCIFLSTIRSGLSFKEKLLLSWIAPRGIVAAAVSSVFALSLEENRVTDADKLVPLVFSVIISTVVLQSLTSSWITRQLELRRPNPETILIIGANTLARAIGKALNELKIPVYLSDPAWENYKLARVAGLPCYYGSPHSEQAERYIPQHEIRYVLALSPNRQLNALGIQHFAHLYGEEQVYSLPPSDMEQKKNRDSATFRSRQVLFGKEVTYSRLRNIIENGGKVKATRLAEAFSWQDFLQTNHDAIPLFVLSDKGLECIITADNPVQPTAGQTVLSLSPAKEAVRNENNIGQTRGDSTS
ncbi:cation:proton antiporter [Tolumonas osonensis]|uniref:NhaP-type Na+/H+ or K+/H+ antiporter n=1 Tax=Tolumonas osonensis TaxID=675874 RepID=A0A841GEW1_9GAMM|nr:sodium:proton antiporter [Tolumonas osonensis]MBB6056499.1 NhaP-type Na+/H+ or K+/H+ antiporter [Tolumonas osonensis]